jgi:Tfp pilus assembly major pilin PilA
MTSRSPSSITLKLGSVVLAAIIIALITIGIPAYQDYRVRTRVLDALTLAERASGYVTTYIEVHRVLPPSIADAGFNESLSPDIQRIEIDRAAGAIVVTLANAPLRDKAITLQFDPRTGKTGWRCLALEIPARYLPPACRE